MRATIAHDSGFSGMRIPYVAPKGKHGFGLPQPKSAFDINRYMIYFVGEFFRSNGAHLTDDPCFARGDCEFFP
ncbi:MAG: hypothetical protein IT381_26265 [Deltaproteobacteria bacterium]|nr:hypothetical protein [Deltaproteobacteria bacterium]